MNETEMRRVTLVLSCVVALAVGCGPLPVGYEAPADAGADAAPLELGTAEQALLYIPPGYGKDPNANRCAAAPWQGACYVPASKSIRIKFFASTCAGDYAKTRVVEATDIITALLNARGWNVTGPDSQDRYDFDVKCVDPVYTPGDNVLGYFTNPEDGTGGTSCSNIQGLGRLCKYAWGNVRIRIGALNNYLYQCPGDARKKVCWRNTLLHEYGHAFGLGHFGASGQGIMMSPGGPGFAGYPAASDTFENAELNMWVNFGL